MQINSSYKDMKLIDRDINNKMKNKRNMDFIYSMLRYLQDQ